MHTIYSYYQYRIYTTILSLFCIIKLILFIITAHLGTAPTKLWLADYFAFACGLLLALQIITNFGIVWSCLLLGAVWHYLFYTTTPLGLASYIFMLLLLILPLCFKINSRSKRDKNIASLFFYGVQFLFFLTLLGTAYAIIYQNTYTIELFVMQFIFFIFIFSPRWIKPKPLSHPKSMILVFDGVCGLCNHFVDFVLAEDRHHLICFTPLQGRTVATLQKAGLGRQLGGPTKIANLSEQEILFYQENTLYGGFTAVYKILQALGGLWRILAVFLYCIPQSLGNVLYRCMARWRYIFFGRKETCRLPTPEEQEYFLP